MEKDILKPDSLPKEKKKFFAFHVAPVRQFRRIVVVSMLVFLAIIGFHAYLLYRVQFFDTRVSANTESLPVPTINQSKLESVLARFQQRSQAQAEAMNAVSPVVDPSK